MLLTRRQTALADTAPACQGQIATPPQQVWCQEFQRHPRRVLWHSRVANNPCLHSI